MKRSSLFGHVIELHDTIISSKRPADVVTTEFFRARHYLGSKDRRFISEMVFGLIRNFRLLTVYALESMTRAGHRRDQKATPAIALVATYCVRMLNEATEALLADVSGLWRVYVSDVDCQRFLESLRQVALPPSIEQDPVLSIATRHSFPDSVVKEWIERFGPEETEQLCATLNSPAPITIRVNTLVATREQCLSALHQEGLEAQPTRLSPVGLTLSKRFNTQSLQPFKRGHFEMQDEGSQLLSMLVQPSPGSTVVDPCAGSGGKTLHLAALMNNKGRLIAIDSEEYRLRNIRERLRRAGVSIAETLLASRDQESILALKEEADAVLIDAPCSGVGTFRRNPGAKLTFTESFVESVAKTQREVLDQYCALVKPGGRLVYSTCTLLRKENEDQVASFLERHTEFEIQSAPAILLQQQVKVGASSPFLTLLPHRTMTDGFFAAVITRRRG